MQLKLSKKGMEAGFLVILIITIASFMLIAGVVMRFMSSAEDKEAEILCHDSIILRAQSVVNIDAPGADAEIKLVPPMCKTIDKKLKGDREKIKQQIADKIARCWWMFGEGKYEEILHGSKVKLLPEVFGFESLENKCFICYNLMIDPKEFDGDGISPDELMEYLYNTKSPYRNATYLNYLQESGGPGSLVFIVSGESGGWDSKIYPGNAYAISFAPKLKDAPSGWKGVLKIGGAVAGAVVIGVATGGTGWIAMSGAVAIGALGASGANNLKASIYSERDVSSIYIDDLKSAQQRCGSGDIAGE